MHEVSGFLDVSDFVVSDGNDDFILQYSVRPFEYGQVKFREYTASIWLLTRYRHTDEKPYSCTQRDHGGVALSSFAQENIVL